MQTNEVAKLLVFINSIDARVVPEDSKIMAWDKVLNPHMPYDMALEYASTHYKNSKDSIMPSDINLMHRNARNIPKFDMGIIEAPNTSVDHEWRKIVTADLKAKIQLDKGKPYTPEITETYTERILWQGETLVLNRTNMGIPWEFEPGTGQYAARAGVDVFAEDELRPENAKIGFIIEDE